MENINWAKVSTSLTRQAKEFGDDAERHSQQGNKELALQSLQTGRILLALSVALREGWE
jgi:hypothetical protein